MDTPLNEGYSFLQKQFTVRLQSTFLRRIDIQQGFSKFAFTAIALSCCAVLLSACGGGDSSASTPAATTSTAGSSTTSSTTSSTSTTAAGTTTGNSGSSSAGLSTDYNSIVGTYNIQVSAADCSAPDGVRQANGACQVNEINLQTGGQTKVLQRDILPVGAYTLTVSSAGLVRITGGGRTVNIACPSGGRCGLAGSPANTVYTLMGGSGSATGAVSLQISQIAFNLSGTPKKVTFGSLYGLGGNVSFDAGTNPLLTGEAGILLFEGR